MINRRLIALSKLSRAIKGAKEVVRVVEHLPIISIQLILSQIVDMALAVDSNRHSNILLACDGDDLVPVIPPSGVFLRYHATLS